MGIIDLSPKFSFQSVDARLIIITVSAVVIGAVFSYFRRRRLIPGVPTLCNDSIFGFTKALFNTNGYDGHRIMLDYAEKYGKLFQFRLLNQHVVVVNDKFMVKEALKNVHGKGFFHVSRELQTFHYSSNIELV